MSTATESAVPAKKSTSRRQAPASSTSAVPYRVGALLAAGVMAWYFLLYVPAKLEYFVGLRLRTLAVASNQVKSKAENLARALQAASRENIAGYLRVLVPEIRLDDGRPQPAGLRLIGGDPKQRTRGTVAWEDVMAQAAEASARDFDDLILATSTGEVVWQRAKNTPRIGNLREVLYAENARSGWFSFSWNLRAALPNVDAKQPLPNAVALTEVRLGVTSSLLVVQTIKLLPDGIETANLEEDTNTLHIAGLVSRTALQRQAMRVPPAWIVLLLLPVVLLFFALPFVKLATLTATERYSFANAVLLLIAAVSAAGLGAIIPFVPSTVDAEGDAALATFANQIEEGLVRDTNAVLDLSQALSTASNVTLTDCLVSVTELPGPRCDLWAALHNAQIPVAPGGLELDVVIWVNESGDQVSKWTTKSQLTGRASHAGFDHFRDLVADRTWTLNSGQTAKADVSPRFTIEPLRTPTTAELGVVLATPLPAANVVPPQFLVLNFRPHALLDPVVPPSYGFAVLAQDGRVLFHSDESLSLQENFFDEVGDPIDVRARALSAHLESWSGDYHGRPHRFHMQPVTSFVNCPWRIVTFQDLEQPLGTVVEHQIGTLRLVLVNLALLAVVALITMGYWRYKRRHIGDVAILSSTSDSRGTVALAVLTGLGCAAIGSTYLPFVQHRLDWLYVFFVSLPLVTMLIVALARRGACRSTSSNRVLRSAELGLLVLLVAGLPAAGFARLAERVQDRVNSQRWLEATNQRITARNARMLARINGPAYRPATRKLLTAPGSFADVTALPAYSYLTFLNRVRIGTMPDTAARPDAGQRLLRRLFGWNLPSSRLEAAAVVESFDQGLWLRTSTGGVAVLAPTGDSRPATSSVLRSAEFWWKLAVGLSILCVTIAAVYWSRRRLLAYAMVRQPELDDALPLIADGGNEGIMLIGPPRTRKDQLLSETVLGRLGAPPAIRIRLLDAVITPDFISNTRRDIDNLLATQGDRVLDSKKRFWIHVSNLETQLVGVESRKQVLQLMEKLLERRPTQPPRVVAVTSSVDPVAHFEEIFRDEREGTYEDFIPEVELSRSSLLLSRFRRCYVRIQPKQTNPWRNYEPTKWRKVLAWEVAGYEPLSQIEDEVERAFPGAGSVSLDDLAHAITTRALAVYQLLWTSCTRREKLALIQLAQEGFVTCQSSDMFAALVAKGLITDGRPPAVFNYTFRAFLRNIERSHVVQEWERMDGNGLWVVVGRLTAGTLVAGAVFFLLTQDYSVESLLPIVSGTGVFGVPLVRNLFARVTGRMTGPTHT